jgi:hypothetical protein
MVRVSLIRKKLLKLGTILNEDLDPALVWKPVSGSGTAENQVEFKVTGPSGALIDFPCSSEAISSTGDDQWGDREPV